MSEISLFQRVRGLLRLARCRIVRESAEHGILLAEHFSPIEPVLTVCVVLSEPPASSVNLARLGGIASALGFEAPETIVYVHREQDARRLDSSQYRVVAVDTLAGTVVHSTGHRERLAEQLHCVLAPEEILPRPCFERDCPDRR